MCLFKEEAKVSDPDKATFVYHWYGSNSYIMFENKFYKKYLVCDQGHPTNLFLTLSVPRRNLAGWQNIRCSNELAGKFLIVRGFGWELLTFLAFQAGLAEKL